MCICWICVFNELEKKSDYCLKCKVNEKWEKLIIESMEMTCTLTIEWLSNREGMILYRTYNSLNFYGLDCYGCNNSESSTYQEKKWSSQNIFWLQKKLKNAALNNIVVTSLPSQRLPMIPCIDRLQKANWKRMLFSHQRTSTVR